MGDVAGDVGKGLVAGAIGAAAMTLSNKLEMRFVTGRSGSTVPAQAVERVTGVEPADQSSETRLNELSHWGYGVAQGAVRGLIGAAGLRGVGGALAHYVTVWGGQQALMPALGIGAPTWRYGRNAIAIDVVHHSVYVAATSLAYEWLDRRSRQ